MHNWHEKFGLLCQQDYIKWALFSYYATQPLVLLWLPSLTDKVGRKKVVQIGAFISTLLNTMMIFTSNKYILITVLALQGAMTPISFNITFIYLLELMPTRSQTLVSTVQNILATFTVIGCALYFTLISKQWLWFVLIGYVLQIV